MKTAEAKKMEVSLGTVTAGPVESDLRKKSRIAAFWYIVMGAPSPFVFFYLPSKFIVPGDATATIANITASPTLFRLGIVLNFISAIGFILCAIALYDLFKTVDKGQARAMVAFVAAYIPLAFLNSLFQIAALLLNSGANYLKAFEPAQLQSLALVFLNMNKQGNFIAEIFWGLWLLPLGILIFKSRFFPKILGVFEVIACFGYLANFLVVFLFPGLRGKINSITFMLIFGELPFFLWLIIKGARLKSPRKTVPAGA
jgi:hypothetical protein